MIQKGFKEAFELLIGGGNDELKDILIRTIKMCLSSSIISLLIAIPFGLILGYFKFKGKNILTVINNTLTGVPPVVCGLVCYALFSGTGIFRHQHLLFSLKGMTIAQVLLITPVLISSIQNYVEPFANQIKETSKGLNLNIFKTMLLLLNESKYQVVSAYILGFSRSMAEVGAVSMVGAAISWRTNVMTTAIMQYTNMGKMDYAFALSVILMLLALVFNIVVYLFQQRLKHDSK